jgi:fumarate hydratase class II
MSTRRERDSHGVVEVPADRYWGAQTARSLTHFPAGGDAWPPPMIHALGSVKRACARANATVGVLPEELAALIVAASEEVAGGALDDHVVAPVWQSGSGTQLNMNVNEVVAGRANELAGRGRGGREPVHPNDHVNRSQSSNDVIPTALHLAAIEQVEEVLLPALRGLEDALDGRIAALGDIVKTGRTHLMDALPVTVGQELGAWRDLVAEGRARLVSASTALEAVPLGGTAVGTGAGAPSGFAAQVVEELCESTRRALRADPAPLARQAAHAGPLAVSGALRDLATSLHKIAEDVRLLASGPRCGLGELVLPANEPGSSMMPGKVNPTQAEMLAMVSLQVLACDQACALAAKAGHLQLNTARPLLALNLLHAVRLLAGGVDRFTRHCIVGLEVDRTVLATQLERSLMLATALVPELGYDRAAAIARRAHAEGLTLREAALADGAVDGATFDRLVRPDDLV